MSDYAISLKRSSLLLAALAFTAVLTIANLNVFGVGKVEAGQFQSRKVVLSSSLAGTETGDNVAGSATNGSAAVHTFTFTTPTGSSTTIDAFEFTYCLEAIGTCTAPPGLNADTAVLVSATDDGGAFTTVFALDATQTTVSRIGIDVNAGATNTITAASVIVIQFSTIVNPSINDDIYVRMVSYSVENYTSAVDDGTVAFSIVTPINITARVKETLGFSTTADTAGGVPAETSACVPLTGSGAIALGDANNTLSIAQAYDDTSYFRVYTNAANGIAVQYAGITLTKGTDDINAIGGTAASSTVGSEQFGFGIYAANPPTANVDNGGWGAAGRLTLNAQYDGGEGTITNGGTATFAYDSAAPNTPKSIATAGSYVTCDTAEVRYIANISPLTPAGTYRTTVVYYAVPTY
ncbi:hypothetical protein H0V99_02015 [Candidatus Saccharibacteria bacterium]|nr:hypothetical protein [Candidatus Saccharibacteria bacterium]